ncbi:MAG: hypothetical protein QOF89_4595 [Acidobacteriota bacterium]|jgi:transcriptional regulator with XRE-family HTH domain|nr:hypothetical protein [Acidobacteriota bacterium]
MDVSEFQEEIAKWRIAAGFTQEELDEKCELRPGTVGRLEQKKLKMTEDHFLRILICTKQDPLWILLASCGSLYARLRPLEAELSKRFRVGPNQYKPLIDEDFQRGLKEMFSGAQVVLTKVARAADPKAWAIDLLLRAASQGAADDQPKRHRVRAKRLPSADPSS